MERYNIVASTSLFSFPFTHSSVHRGIHQPQLALAILVEGELAAEQLQMASPNAAPEMISGWCLALAKMIGNHEWKVERVIGCGWFILGFTKNIQRS